MGGCEWVALNERCLVGDGEAGDFPVRLQIFKIDAIHTRSRWSIAQPIHELLDAGTWALDLKLDFTAR